MANPFTYLELHSSDPKKARRNDRLIREGRKDQVLRRMQD